MSNTKNLANLASALDDGTSGQVLQSTGSGGVQFADSSGSGVTVHANQAAMLTDAASADEGTLHYENNTNKLYVKQSSGFYLLASITNASPTIDSFSEATGGASANNLTAGGTFTLTSGSNTVITINATEPDLETISYSATVTSGTATDVFSSPSFPVTNQSSNVFTLTPVTSGTGGTVTIRFDASDGTNVANVSHSFEIAFVIADSHYTTLLMATDGSAGNNQDDITDAAGNHTNNITVNGDIYAGTVSPYRHGGYSLDIGSGSSYVYTSNHSDFAFGTGYFSVEAWINFSSFTNSGFTNTQNSTSTASSGQWYVVFISSTVIRMGGHGAANYTDATVAEMTVGDWHHVILKRDGNGFKVFVDGTEATSYSSTGTAVASQNFSSSSGTLTVGYSAGTGPALGKIADFRILKGGAASTSTPTERLTEITNTVLLTAHTNRIFDETGTHTLTPTGTVTVSPSGPHDTEQYSESTNGGSLYFDGSGDYLDFSGGTSLDLDGTDFTIEAWFYRTSTNSAQMLCNFALPHTTIGISLNRTGGGDTYVYLGDGGANWSGGTNPNINTGSTNPLRANEWNHIALVRSGTGTGSQVVTLYHNGVSTGTTTTVPSGMTGNLRIGAYSHPTAATGEFFGGYISDFRVAKEAVYTGAFTPPSGPLTTTGGTYPSTTNVDTSITSELLLSGTDAHVLDKSQGNNLKLIGTTAAVTSSSSPTPPNNTTISSQNSIFFDGNSDYITLADNELYGWGTGSWTFEVWLYITKTGGFNAIFDTRVPGTQTGSFGLGVHTTGKVQMYASPSAFYYPQGSGDVLSFNTWQHLAIVKDASTSTTTMYFNGTAASTTYSDTRNYGASQPVQIGKDDTTSNYFGGYMQDMRITKGLARTISVPSAPLKG